MKVFNVLDITLRAVGLGLFAVGFGNALNVSVINIWTMLIGLILFNIRPSEESFFGVQSTINSSIDYAIEQYFLKGKYAKSERKAVGAISLPGYQPHRKLRNQTVR